AGFLHVFRVLEMQCFVLSYLLSPKPTRWTLRPASRKHGLSFHHFWLYEPNRDVHQSLAGNFRGLSFTINSGIFHASDMPAQSVSTAVMIHVLDHLLQPKEFLHEVRASLEPGGVILIVTHDCGVWVGPFAGTTLAALHAAASAALLAALACRDLAGKRIRRR